MRSANGENDKYKADGVFEVEKTRLGILDKLRKKVMNSYESNVIRITDRFQNSLYRQQQGGK